LNQISKDENDDDQELISFLNKTSEQSFLENSNKNRKRKSEVIIDLENLNTSNSVKKFKQDQTVEIIEDDEEQQEVVGYNFEVTQEYYDNRDEYKYVGIIDKDTSLKKSQEMKQVDLFKIREKRSKVLDKKRGTGIPSLKGAVCTTKEKSYIDKVAKDLGVKDEDNTRQSLCEAIRNKMLELEKYQTGDSKKTYIMIPSNHPIYPFPYNLEDRAEYIMKNLKDQIPIKISASKKKSKEGYIITIVEDSKLKDYQEIFDKYKAEKTKEGYIIKID